MDYYIPSFEDDPKNRLMDEITFTDTLVSPQKRSRIETPQSDEDATESREGEGDDQRIKVQYTPVARTNSRTVCSLDGSALQVPSPTFSP